jgi:hypothetical protein
MDREVGSDAQMTPEQIAEAKRQYDLARAEAMEEERKTAARPVEDGDAAA